MPHFHFHPHPPDKPISAAAGTPYPTPQSEIDILQDRTRAPATNPYLSIGRATGSLEKFHRRPRNPREEEALERLEDLQHATDHFGKDVVFKVFDDIDTVLPGSCPRTSTSPGLIAQGAAGRHTRRASRAQPASKRAELPFSLTTRSCSCRRRG